MAYRDAPQLEEETLASSHVLLSEGADVTAALAVFGGCFAVVSVVIFFGTELALAVPAALGAFGVLCGIFAVVTRRRRGRTMRVVRRGTTTTLVVAGELELALPLAASGEQQREGNGVRVILKLVDRHGKAVTLRENRAPIQGERSDWYTEMDGAPALRSYDLPGGGDLGRVRSQVVHLSALAAKRES